MRQHDEVAQDQMAMLLRDTAPPPSPVVSSPPAVQTVASKNPGPMAVMGSSININNNSIVPEIEDEFEECDLLSYPLPMFSVGSAQSI